MNEGIHYENIERGNKGKELLLNPLFNEIFEIAREKAFRLIEGGTLNEEQTKYLVIYTQALKNARKNLIKIVETGELSDREMKQQASNKKRFF